MGGVLWSLRGQGIKGALAGNAAGASVVSRCRHVRKSLSERSEHVGKHQAGAGSCLASLGSAGIAGGFGGEGIGCCAGCVAQADSSSASAHGSSSAGLLGFSFSTCNPFNVCGAARLFGARLGFHGLR
jgi:hypothetical protein